MKEFTFEQIIEIIMLINEINQRNEDKESVNTANNVSHTLKDLGITNTEQRNVMINYICHGLTHENFKSDVIKENKNDFIIENAIEIVANKIDIRYLSRDACANLYTTIKVLEEVQELLERQNDE